MKTNFPIPVLHHGIAPHLQLNPSGLSISRRNPVHQPPHGLASFPASGTAKLLGLVQQPQLSVGRWSVFLLLLVCGHIFPVLKCENHYCLCWLLALEVFHRCLGCHQGPVATESTRPSEDTVRCFAGRAVFRSLPGETEGAARVQSKLTETRLTLVKELKELREGARTRANTQIQCGIKLIQR